MNYVSDDDCCDLMSYVSDDALHLSDDGGDGDADADADAHSAHTQLFLLCLC